MIRSDYPDSTTEWRGPGADTGECGRTDRETGPELAGERGIRPENGRHAYEVTYAFRGHLRGACGEAVSRASAALSSLRSEGVDVAFRGATLRLDADSRVITASVRFVAPDEGAIARLNCRAELPVSGIRRTDS